MSEGELNDRMPLTKRTPRSFLCVRSGACGASIPLGAGPIRGGGCNKCCLGRNRRPAQSPTPVNLDRAPVLAERETGRMTAFTPGRPMMRAQER